LISSSFYHALDIFRQKKEQFSWKSYFMEIAGLPLFKKSSFSSQRFATLPLLPSLQTFFFAIFTMLWAH